MQKCKEFLKKHLEIVFAIVKLIIFALIVFISFGCILGITTADSDYMQPGVKYHDNLIYSRIDHDYALRDVVIYEYEGKTYVGRIVGMPGDTISTNVNGNIFQNDFLVYEEDIRYTVDRSKEVTITLGDNQYFIICDNRSQNFDSRTFGAIEKKDIKGKVIMVWRRFNI